MSEASLNLETASCVSGFTDTEPWQQPEPSFVARGKVVAVDSFDTLTGSR